MMQGFPNLNIKFKTWFEECFSILILFKR